MEGIVPDNTNRNENPEDLEEVFYVLRRGRRGGGRMEYCLGSNLMPRPKGWRQEFGTSSLSRDIAVSRVQKCEDGTWWKEKRDRGLEMSRVNQAQRKAIHEAYKKSRRKESFEWWRIRRLTRAF